MAVRGRFRRPSRTNEPLQLGNRALLADRGLDPGKLPQRAKSARREGQTVLFVVIDVIFFFVVFFFLLTVSYSSSASLLSTSSGTFSSSTFSSFHDDDEASQQPGRPHISTTKAIYCLFRVAYSDECTLDLIWWKKSIEKLPLKLVGVLSLIYKGQCVSLGKLLRHRRRNVGQERLQHVALHRRHVAHRLHGEELLLEEVLVCHLAQDAQGY